MACLSKLKVALMAAVAVSGFVSLSPAIAQTVQDSDVGTANTLNPNQGFPSSDAGADLLTDPMGPMELIHRAVLMNNMSLTEFRQQQQQRISDEASSFRQLQQEALRRQPAVTAEETAN
ncbi:MAG: hypothetical protein ICV77_16650 [Cyanobacteria bacterium Co-bin8]|nr:hypothetical protein [Cyanobacteria bacterium Co-bin8]